MPSSSSSGTTKFIEVGVKLLSVLVIPLIMWGVRLEVKTTVTQDDLEELQDDLDKLSEVRDVVQKNSLALVRLEGKLDNVDEKIDDVKTLLRDRGQ